MNEEDIKDDLRTLHKILWNEHREETYTIQRALEYINQLESDKQKLIEKLEKRRKRNNDKYGRAIDTDEFPEMYEYSGQVEEDDYLLSIVKGGNNER